MSFPASQPDYAAHKIACFPVDKDSKKPSITHPHRLGLGGSAQLVLNFPLHDALGFWAGPRNGITVLDVDVPGKEGERLLADLSSSHGCSKFIVRTGGGKFHAYYRNNAEPKIIKMFGKDGPAVDLLGSGVVVAAPSKMRHGSYEIIQGSMNDLDRLTKLQNLEIGAPYRSKEERGLGKRENEAAEGQRNDALFRHCLRAARYCDSLNDLIDEARTFCGEAMVNPISDMEVVKTAKSAWRYQERGENWVKCGTDNLEGKLMDLNQDAYLLYKLVRRFNSGRVEFFVTNSAGDRLGWPRARTIKARRFLMESGVLEIVSQQIGSSPAVYRWAPASSSKL